MSAPTCALRGGTIDRPRTCRISRGAVMQNGTHVTCLVIATVLMSASVSAAQTLAHTSTPLVIHNVTLREETRTLTIVGAGFGTSPVVTVDGQPATVLLGGTDGQLDVEAPAAIF